MGKLILSFLLILTICSCAPASPPVLGKIHTSNKERVQLFQYHLEGILTETLKGCQINDAAKVKLKELTSLGTKAYEENPTQGETIEQNFNQLLSVVYQNKTVNPGTTPTYEITVSSIEQALKICPLYPFC